MVLKAAIFTAAIGPGLGPRFKKCGLRQTEPIVARFRPRFLRKRGLRPNGPKAAFLCPKAAFSKRGLRTVFS